MAFYDTTLPTPFVRPFVPILLFWGCPTHVARFVISVFVGVAVQGHPRWAIPNAGEYVGEINGEIIPAVTNFNSESAVVFVLFDVGVVASGPHTMPSPVQRMESPFSGVTMRQVPQQAATRSNFALFEASGRGNFSVSTNASALPQNIACRVPARGWLKSGQSTEALIRDIAVFGHRSAPIGSRSSDEVGVRALASLRTLALIVKEG